MNVSSGTETTTQELVEILERHMDVKADVTQEGIRPGDVERAILSPTLCSKYIGDPTGLDEGLARTVEWVKSR